MMKEFKHIKPAFTCFDYVTSSRFLELVFYIGLLYLSTLIPFEHHQQAIPYQILNDGQVILDPDYNKPYLKNDDQGALTLNIFVLHGLTPLLCLVVTGLLLQLEGGLHRCLCVYFCAVTINKVTTDFLKNYCGTLRPNFYHLCDFDVKALACTGGLNLEMAGRKSFPSSHSSVSFCTMTLLTGFLITKITTISLTPREHTHLKFMNRIEVKRLLVLLAFTPIAVAVCVGAARIRGYWHHPIDVIGGAIIGTVSSGIAWFLFYGHWGSFCGGGGGGGKLNSKPMLNLKSSLIQNVEEREEGDEKRLLEMVG